MKFQAIEKMLAKIFERLSSKGAELPKKFTERYKIPSLMPNPMRLRITNLIN